MAPSVGVTAVLRPKAETGLYEDRTGASKRLNYWGSEWIYVAEQHVVCVISGFHREGNENCALLACYAACSGILYRRFGTIYLFHLQRSRIHSRSLKMGREGCAETSVRNYHYALLNRPEERSWFIVWLNTTIHIALLNVSFVQHVSKFGFFCRVGFCSYVI